MRHLIEKPLLGLIDLRQELNNILLYPYLVDRVPTYELEISQCFVWIYKCQHCSEFGGRLSLDTAGLTRSSDHAALSLKP